MLHHAKPPISGRMTAAAVVSLALFLSLPAFAEARFRERPAAKKSRRVKPQPITIGHQLLRLEERLGASDADRRALDGLIERATAVVPDAARRGRRTARRALQSIEIALRESGFRDGSSSLLHRAMRDRRADCDTRTILYLSIAEALRLPLVAARVEGAVPGHVIIRWRLAEGRFLDWETLTGSEFVPSNAHLRNLNRDEVVGLHHFNLGIEWARRGELVLASDSLGESLARDDTVAVVHATRAEVLLRTFVQSELRQSAALEQAFASVHRAVQMDPRDSNAHVLRSIVQYYRGRRGESMKDIRTAVRLDRQNPAARYYLGLALFKRGQTVRAIREFSRTIALGSRSGNPFGERLVLSARLQRGLAYERRRGQDGGRPTARNLVRAIRDASICLAAQPDNREVKDLLSRLSLQRASLPNRPRAGADALQAAIHASRD